jgi:hypothetical protein
MPVGAAIVKWYQRRFISLLSIAEKEIHHAAQERKAIT